MRNGLHRARASVIGGVVVFMAASSVVDGLRNILSAARAVEAGAR